MSLERQVRERSPARASSDTPKRATTSLTTEQAKADLLREIAAKQAELASLQEQAIAAEDGAAEPSKKKVLHKQLTNKYLTEAKSSKGEEASIATEPAASRALVQAPVPFKSADVRTHAGVLSSKPVATAPVKKKFVHRLVTERDVEVARLQVQEDREKAASFRDERTKLLERVNLLDQRVDLFDGSVLEGAAAVVQLLQRQRWQKQQAIKAEIAREALGPKTPIRAISSTSSSSMGHAGSSSPAPLAGPSRPRPASPTPGPPRATSSPKARFVGTIPKLPRDAISDAQAERSRNREKCGYRGRARSQSRTSSRSSTPRGGQYHGSAGHRNRRGDRVSHPPQDRGHSRRLGAGQRARPHGSRSQVDGHNRSLVDPMADSTLDWSREEMWEEDEEGR